MNHLFKMARSLTRRGDNFLEKHGSRNFHEEARNLLLGAKLHEHFDYRELMLSSFSKGLPPDQNFKFLEFSDLPLTIARGSGCFIDIYFWRRRPTVIHNHHFAGAFQCLRGNNVDLEFTFEAHKKVGRFHALGELRLHQVRNLRPGDVAPIAELDGFIHQNHHQADLTVNLCFRTPELSKRNLSNYLFTGLRYERAHSVIAKVQRLLRFVDILDVKIPEVEMSTDEMIYFLIETHGRSRGHPRLDALRKRFHRIIEDEHGFSLKKLLEGHEKRFDQIEAEYE